MFTYTMPFTYEETCFVIVKIYQTTCKAPNSQDTNLIDYTDRPI